MSIRFKNSEIVKEFGNSGRCARGVILLHQDSSGLAMNKKTSEDWSDPRIGAAARVLSAEWLGSSSRRERTNGCFSLREIEDYVSGRTAMVVGSRLLDHVMNCTLCRTRSVALDLMQTRSGNTHIWRLKYLRSLVKQQSGKGCEIAARVKAWLSTLATGVSERRPITQTLDAAFADGAKTQIPTTQIVIPSVDSQGRLLVQYKIGIPAGSRATILFYLADEANRFELFSTTLRETELAAVVDLSCCTNRAISLPSESLRIEIGDLQSESKPMAQITSRLEAMREIVPFDMGVIDSIIGMSEAGILNAEAIEVELTASPDKARSAHALAYATDIVFRYAQMLSIANEGLIPDSVSHLCLELANLGADDVVSTDSYTAESYRDSATARISELLRDNGLRP